MRETMSGWLSGAAAIVIPDVVVVFNGTGAIAMGGIKSPVMN